MRAFVCGCAGLELSFEERALFRATAPWGLILFKRNVATPDQVGRLAAAFRDTVGRGDAPVFVDQEGGRVQRLGPPLWPPYPSGAAYAALFATDPAKAEHAARAGGRLIAHDLAALGIDVDCAPVLDVRKPGGTAAIGDRALGQMPGAVARLGRAFADGLMAGGVLPVIKHLPGHGRAEVDSHFSLPVVTAERAALEEDFAPFRALADLPLAMTAHVVFAAIDAARPATLSATVIDAVIRGEIGFDGLLLTDDLSMEALRGTLRERAEAAFAAGCDVALHCNGKLDEARAVADAAPALEGRALRRAEAALARRRAPEAVDLAARRADLAAAGLAA